jgi:hypothetical protein
MQRSPKEIMQIFLIEDFSHLPPLSTTPVVHLELRISQQIFKKIRNSPIGIIRGLGETDSWKKREVKKSRHTVPLNEADPHFDKSRLHISSSIFNNRKICRGFLYISNQVRNSDKFSVYENSPNHSGFLNNVSVGFCLVLNKLCRFR